MAFKLKSGNKPSFKEMGSSPLKAEPGLADPMEPLPADVPSDVIIGESTAYDPANPNVNKSKKINEEEEVENGEAVESVLPQGTGEEYIGRKERRARKQYRKEAYKSESGKNRLTQEQRRNIKQDKLEMKQAEARSKGTVSYGAKWSLAGGLQEGVEPKASRLQRRIDKVESRRKVDDEDNSTRVQSDLSKQKDKTKTLRKERKGGGFLRNLFKRK